MKNPEFRVRKRQFKSCGLELSAFLVLREMKPREVVARVHANGDRLSLAGLQNFLGGGDTVYGPKTLNKVLDAVGVTPDERERLNQCAARDAGWRIGWNEHNRLARRPAHKQTRGKEASRLGLRNPYKVKGLQVQYVPTLQVWKLNGGSDE